MTVHLVPWLNDHTIWVIITTNYCLLSNKLISQVWRLDPFCVLNELIGLVQNLVGVGSIKCISKLSNVFFVIKRSVL